MPTVLQAIDWSTLASTASSWLLTYLLHSTILIAAISLVARSRWIRSLAVRDTLWKVALFGGVITATLQVGAGLTPLTGNVEFAVDPAGQTTEALPAVAEFSAPPTEEIESDAESEDLLVDAVDVAISGDNALGSAVATANPSSAVSPAPHAFSRKSWPLIAAALWLAGAIFGLTRLGLARLQLSRCLRRRQEVGDPQLQITIANLSDVGGLRKPVRLTWSAHIPTPVALRSEVCLPRRALVELSTDQLRSILAHEIAHVVRRDSLWLTATLLVERVFFFQPLNAVARRNIREVAEYLCDDWAVYHTRTKMTLAKCLFEVAAWIKTPRQPTLVPSMGEDSSQLVRRVERILKSDTISKVGASMRAHATASVGIFLLVGLTVPGVSCAGAPVNADLPARAGTATTRPAAVADNPVDKPEPLPVDDFELLAVASADVPFDEVISPGFVEVSAADFTDATVLASDYVTTAALDFGLLSGGVRYVTAEPMEWLNADVSALETSLSLAQNLLTLRAQSDTVDPRIVASLVKALRDPDPGVRKEAAAALGRLRAKSAVPGLIGALDDEYASVRASAASSLGRLKDLSSVEPLIGALSDTSHAVRKQALSALSNLRDVRAIPGFIRALRDESADLRTRAANALGRIRDGQSVAPLIEVLSDTSAAVRRAAISALANLRDPQAIPALGRLLRDESARVRLSAVRALAKFRDRRTVEPLIEALADSSASVRKAAASTLGTLQDPRAVEPLIAALEDENAEVRATAVRALSKIRR